MKDRLELYGLQVFVAHEDIAPSSMWRKEILAHIEDCQLFLAFLTHSYTESDWTDQEFGIAKAKGKRVLPVVTAGDGRVMPYGFMDEFQAFFWESRNIEKSLRELVLTVLDRLSLPSENLVRGFESSESFDDAGFGLQLLLARTDLTSDQVNRTARAYLENPQIRQSSSARSAMTDFFRVHKGVMDPSLRERIGRMPSGEPRGQVVR
jgi:hypothetical protein